MRETGSRITNARERCISSRPSRATRWARSTARSSNKSRPFPPPLAGEGQGGGVQPETLCWLLRRPHPRSDGLRRRLFVVLERNVLLRTLFNSRHRDEGDHGADRDVPGDRHAGVVARDLDTRPGDHTAGEEKGRNNRRRPARKDGRQLVTERGTAIAQPPGVALGDERRLWAVLGVVRDQREEDGKEDKPRRLRIQQAEVDKAPDAHRHHARHVHPLAAKPVREIAEQWDGDEGKDRGAGEGEEDVVAGLLQRPRRYRIGEDIGGKDIEGSLLGEPQERRLQDLFPVATDDFGHGGRFDLPLIEKALEAWSLEA